jgi:hypothetical protein
VISLAEIWQAWQHFFHDPQPVATLCVFRILFGLVLVFNGCTLLPFARDFFGPLGLLGIKRFAKAYPQARVSLFYFLPATDQSAVAMVLLQITASAAMVLGLATTISVPLAWLALVSLHHRNPVIFNAGDTVQRLLLLLLCFTPSGAALSIDCWLRGENALQAMRNEFDPWPVRLMQIQISILYLRSVFWKLRGERWRNGTAVAYVLQVMSFRRYSAPQLALVPAVYRTLTWGTLVIETYIPIAVWIRETRWSAIAAAWLLHLTLDMFLNVHLFGPTMCAGLVLFVGPTDILFLFSIS